MRLWCAVLLATGLAVPQFVIRGVDPPLITNLSPSSGSVGTLVTITGSGFNATQGSGTVTFNGVSATVTSWSATSITASVPTGATTGTVYVFQNGVRSTGFDFTVIAAAAYACAQSAGTGSVLTVGSGKTYATLALCATAATAGQTCDVYTGSYGGFTVASGHDGTAGNPVTYQCHTGETCTMTGSIAAKNRSYLLIKDFTWHSGVLYAPDDSTGGVTTTNHINLCGGTVSTPTSAGSGLRGAIQLWGNSNVVENMTMDFTGADLDYIDLGGQNVVVRHLILHGADGTGIGGEPHIDHVQAVGSLTPVLTFALVEDVFGYHCVNDTGNCHFGQIRSAVGFPTTGLIWRYSVGYDMDSGGVGYQGSDGGTPNGAVYHNTISNPNGNDLGNGSGNDISMGSSGALAINNISYDTPHPASFCPIFVTSGTKTSNIYYKPGSPTQSWPSVCTSESTWGTLGNLNPQFANWPTNASLSSGSGAINVAAALTTVASGDVSGTTTLKLANVYPFQPGWAGISGDQIKVGSNSPVTISSIDYVNSTVTISSGITRSVGDGVRLYRLTTGTVVLTNTNGDIGACPYGVTGLVGCQ